MEAQLEDAYLVRHREGDERLNEKVGQHPTVEQREKLRNEAYPLNSAGHGWSQTRRRTGRLCKRMGQGFLPMPECTASGRLKSREIS